MPKRIADKRLTDQNWDKEDNYEIPDEHQSRIADESVLKRRVMKKAKRNLPPSGSRPGTGVFVGFNGLKSTTGGAVQGSADGKGFSLKFGGGSKSFLLPTKNTSAAADSTSASAVGFKFTRGDEAPMFGAKSTGASTTVDAVPAALQEVPLKVPKISAQTEQKPEQKHKPATVAKATTKETTSSTSSKSSKMDDYNVHLSVLNKSVNKWIEKHVNENPYVDLSPIFADYKKHLKEIELKYNQGETEEETDESVSPMSLRSERSRASQLIHSSQSSNPTSPELHQRGAKLLKSTDTTDSSNNGGGSFISSTTTTTAPPAGLIKNPLAGLLTKTATPPTTSTFKGFGGFKTSEPAASAADNNSGGGFKGFSFNSDSVRRVTPQSTSAVSTEATTTTTTTATAESEEPPKIESVKVEEDGAIFSKKCKLFYKSDGGYKDKGVGYMHLKPVESGENKTQFIIRADTATGTILLNVIVNPKLPAPSKQGKNNVVFTCVPNPPIQGIAANQLTPLLLRVKTSDDADEVIDMIKKVREESN